MSFIPTSRVFIVQRPTFFDKEKRTFVDKYDLSPAADYGELIYLVKPGSIFRDQMRPAIAQMKIGLAGFTNFDFLLAVGDPVAIAAAVLIASAASGGPVKLLKWDRIKGEYEAFTVDPKRGE